MSDPFKIEEEEPKTVQPEPEKVGPVVFVPGWNLTPEELGQSVGLDPKSIPNPDFVPSNEGSVLVTFNPDGTGQVVKVENPQVRWRINPEFENAKPLSAFGFFPQPLKKPHHSTLKKRDKVTINCRLKRENAEWLRSVAPKGPGGVLEIGSVLDGLVDRARESGGAL